MAILAEILLAVERPHAMGPLGLVVVIALALLRVLGKALSVCGAGHIHRHGFVVVVERGTG